MCLGRVSEGTVVRARAQGKGTGGGIEREADCAGHRRDFGFFSM